MSNFKSFCGSSACTSFILPADDKALLPFLSILFKSLTEKPKGPDWEGTFSAHKFLCVTELA